MTTVRFLGGESCTLLGTEGKMPVDIVDEAFRGLWGHDLFDHRWPLDGARIHLLEKGSEILVVQTADPAVSMQRKNGFTRSVARVPVA